MANYFEMEVELNWEIDYNNTNSDKLFKLKVKDIGEGVAAVIKTNLSIPLISTRKQFYRFNYSPHSRILQLEIKYCSEQTADDIEKMMQLNSKSNNQSSGF